MPARQKQLQGYYATSRALLRFAVADVALATCSGISTSPKLLITPRNVTEVQSDPANIADLAKWCQSHTGRAKVIHVLAFIHDISPLNAQQECWKSAYTSGFQVFLPDVTIAAADSIGHPQTSANNVPVMETYSWRATVTTFSE